VLNGVVARVQQQQSLSLAWVISLHLADQMNRLSAILINVCSLYEQVKCVCNQWFIFCTLGLISALLSILTVL